MFLKLFLLLGQFIQQYFVENINKILRLFDCRKKSSTLQVFVLLIFLGHLR